MQQPRRRLLACRVSVGEQDNYGFEIHGTKGRRLLGLQAHGGIRRQHRDRLPGPAGEHRLRRPGQGDYAAFQPGSAIVMGYNDLKVIEACNFLRSFAEGTAHGATLDDAVRSAAALEAMLSSAERGTWVNPA